jgi:hypothetical protein
LDGKEIERERERGRGGSKARAGNKVVWLDMDDAWMRKDYENEKMGCNGWYGYYDKRKKLDMSWMVWFMINGNEYMSWMMMWLWWRKMDNEVMDDYDYDKGNG